jgi:hypothetical protein
MEITPGRWVARVGNLSSTPLPLGAAKKAAIELYHSNEKGEPKDWIKELNRVITNEIDRPARITEPVDLLGGTQGRGAIDRDLRKAIFDADCQLVDHRPPKPSLPIIHGRINGIFDTQAELEAYRRALASPPPELEYHEDGYPKLPACLDRRMRKIAEPLARAA